MLDIDYDLVLRLTDGVVGGDLDGWR